jgi:hypothetical protein
MNHPIECSCGKVKGILRQKVNRVVCYCQDCQAFARFLDHDREILDEIGGTAIVQTTPKSITFTAGTQYLACMRLTPTGLLRWYATCCNTPIGNTPADFKLSFVGLVHNCLVTQRAALDEIFGSIQMSVHPQDAKGEPKPKAFGLVTSMSRSSTAILKARIDGSYRDTPFFVPESGFPIVTPIVLSDRELEILKQ